MLSKPLIGFPQVGQALRGVTTDRPSGTRMITTFRNEPMISRTRRPRPRARRRAAAGRTRSLRDGIVTEARRRPQPSMILERLNGELLAFKK